MCVFSIHIVLRRRKQKLFINVRQYWILSSSSNSIIVPKLIFLSHIHIRSEFLIDAKSQNAWRMRFGHLGTNSTQTINHFLRFLRTNSNFSLS